MASNAIEEAVSNPIHQLYHSITDHLPNPKSKPTGYNFQGRSTAFKTGRMSRIINPPPCIPSSPLTVGGFVPFSTRFLVLMAVCRKKILMTAIKKRKTAETAVPTVPPISPTANYQLYTDVKGGGGVPSSLSYI